MEANMKRFMLAILLVFTWESETFSQWVCASGAGSGKHTCVALNSTSLFAGTEFGGVIRSTNAGESWIPMDYLPSQLPIYSIANDGASIYAGKYGGVLWSSNNGLTWTEIKDGLPQSKVSALNILEPYIFAATLDSGVFRLPLGGERWSSVSLDSFHLDVYSMGVAGSYIFTCIHDSLFRSSDFGSHWDFLARMNIDCFASAGTFLFAGNSLGAYRSTDFGSSWDEITAGLPESWIRAIAANDRFLFVGTYRHGLCVSTDNGNTWNQLPVASTDSANGIIAIAVGQDSLLVSTVAGVFFSKDAGATWSRGNGNLGKKYVWQFAPMNDYLFAGTDYGVYCSVDSGKNWSCVVRSEKVFGERIVNLFTNGNYLYAVNNYAEMFRTEDNGVHWRRIVNAWTKYTCFTVSEGSLFAGTAFDGVLQSTNDDSVWVKVNEGLPDLKISNLTSIGSVLFVATDAGIFKTMNRGVRWEPVTQLGSLQASILQASGSFIFAGNSSDSLFFSSDTGVHWKRIEEELPNLKIEAIAESDGNIFVALKNSGIYLSSDGANSWNAVTEEYTLTNVWTLATQNDQLFAGTGGNGVWRRPLSEMLSSVENNRNNVPSHFVLRQNYPNPFNPTTTIEYQLPEASKVTMKVYDILGREVATLVDDEVKAGYHIATFDGSKHASGIYFVRMTAQGSDAKPYFKTMKIVLMK